MSEWDEVVFDDLPEMELFWLKPGRQYPAYRKMDDGSIQNTKTREHSTLGAKIKVFVRS